MNKDITNKLIGFMDLHKISLENKDKLNRNIHTDKILKEDPNVIGAFEARFKEGLARMKNLSEGRDTRDEYRYDLLRIGVS